MKGISSNMSILHSRFSEVRRYQEDGSLDNRFSIRTKKKKAAGETIDLVPNVDAHPCVDYMNKISFFHNGSIANFTDLVKEVKNYEDITPEQKAAHKDITDSQLVAFLISY